MTKSYTHYWSQTTEFEEDETLDHTASNCFSKLGLSTGDRIFVISSERRRPVLIGRLIAKSPPLSKRDAARELTKMRRLSINASELWDAKDHVIAKRGTASKMERREIPIPVLRALRFHSPTGTKPLKFSAPNQVDQQTLRGVRRLTEESADQLNDLLTEFLREKSSQETSTAIPYIEGASSPANSMRYERNPKARRACIREYGCKCFICGFNFTDRYGKIGKDFIEVHHRFPISNRGGKYTVDPVQDLIPVCPNCHAMLHRGNTPPSVEKLQSICRI